MSYNEIIMPFKDPVAAKEYQLAYYQKNKEKKLEYKREYHKNNKDKIKEWEQSPAGRKSGRIQNWKRKGVIHDDFNELYEKYINTEFCEECNCKLTVDRYPTKTTRCLDHCHETGEFRNVLCNYCNLKRR